jgi:hypothetical protein
MSNIGNNMEKYFIYVTGGFTMFTCPFCKERLNTRDGFKEHLMEMHHEELHALAEALHHQD